MGPLMPLQRILPAATFLPGLLLVAAAAWWGLSSFGTGQPAAAQSASPITAAGRVGGGSDGPSLGTSATGTIAALQVKAGDHVEPGQHLVRVECGNANPISQQPRRLICGPSTVPGRRKSASGSRMSI